MLSFPERCFENAEEAYPAADRYVPGLGSLGFRDSTTQLQAVKRYHRKPVA